MKENRLLYFALGVLSVTTIGSGLALRNDGIEFPDGTVQTSAAGASKTVYLTDAIVQGAGALAACTEPGFHMASISEIPDPQRLTYAKDVPSAETDVDLGDGLPAGFKGWIRTGWVSNGDGQPGEANCETWTAGVGNGTVATIRAGTPGWELQVVDCGSFPSRVWCAAD